MVNKEDILKLVAASDQEAKNTEEEQARRQNFCDSCPKKTMSYDIETCGEDKYYVVLKTTFIKSACPLDKWLV